MTTQTETPTETYRHLRALRAPNGCRTSTPDACREIMRAHGISADQAADICWRAETGEPAPAWELADGSPTKAAMDYTAAADKTHDED